MLNLPRPPAAGPPDDRVPGRRAAVLPDRFRGLPVLDRRKCPDGCRACAEACPTDAIAHRRQRPALDLGRCLFCTECVEACPEGAIRYTRDYRLATRRRDDLVARRWQTLELRRGARRQDRGVSSAARSSSAR